MRVLMLSRDASGLDRTSATASRWRLLRDSGAELDVIVASGTRTSWEEQGIRVTGTGGGLIRKFVRTCRLARMQARSADVITAQDPFELGWIAYRVSGSKPFELQDHGGFFDGYQADEPLWEIRSRLAKWLSRRASRIRTVSPLSAERLRDMGLEKKTLFLPIAADARFASIERQPEPDLIVSVGRLVRVKRPLLTLAVFLEYKKSHPQARLMFVGGGPLLSALKSSVAAAGMTDAVDFVGDADPAPFLARASAFVLLSSHEGWGVAPIEAAMAGVPVVMTATGCATWLEAQGLGKAVALHASVKDMADALAASAALEGRGARHVPLLSREEAAHKQVEAWRALV